MPIKGKLLPIEQCRLRQLSNKPYALDEGENALVVKDLDGLPRYCKRGWLSLYYPRLAALVYRATTFKPDTVLYVVEMSNRCI